MATEEKNKELKNPPIYPLESYRQAKPEDFINYWQKILPSGKKKFTPSELMKVENNKGVTNLDIIWGTYDKEEQVKYKSDYDSGTLPYIKQGTVLWCPKGDTPISLVKAAKEGQFVSQGSFKAYWGDNYEELISDPEYLHWKEPG